MKLKDYVAVVTSSALVLLIGGLVVQSRRHGWPFSAHHGVTPAVSAAHDAHTVAGEQVAHPRVAVELELARAEAIGAQVVTVRQEAITRSFRAVATVVPDEARLSHVHTRVAGWIEQLFVPTTGEQIREGHPLAAIFSQELLSSQAEYLAARRAAADGRKSIVLEGARSRLNVLGMTDAEIRAIEESGQPRRLVTITAPRSGIVFHRGISAGMAVDPSTEIVTVADLSRVWVIAEVPENQIANVTTGAVADLDFAASGRGPFAARVEFVYPTLSERTRTLRVRFAVDNSNYSLRPGMYGAAAFQLAPRSALTVPRDAVVDTGTAQHVFVLEDEKRFVPRTIKLGARLSDRVEVLEGVAAGDRIVASGVFLIDSESRLRASGGGTGHGHGGGAPKKTESRKPEASHEGHRGGP